MGLNEDVSLIYQRFYCSKMKKKEDNLQGLSYDVILNLSKKLSRGRAMNDHPHPPLRYDQVPLQKQSEQNRGTGSKILDFLYPFGWGLQNQAYQYSCIFATE